MPATRSASYVKTHFAEIIREVNASRTPLVVTRNGTGVVVIQDHETYQRTRDALMMLKLVAMGEADIARGRTHSHAEVFASLRKRLKAQIAAEARAKANLRSWRTRAASAGLSQMTDAEIEAEIAAVRKERRTRSKTQRPARA